MNDCESTVRACEMAHSERMSAYIVFMREKLRDKSEFDIYSGLAGATLAGHTNKVHAAYGECVSLKGAPIEGAVIIESRALIIYSRWGICSRATGLPRMGSAPVATNRRPSELEQA